MSVSERCLGLLRGLAAGDRNGGPIRMAIILGETFAEHLLSQSTSRNSPLVVSPSSSERSIQFRRAVAEAYWNWYKSGRAFDYGTAFGTVFQRLTTLDDLDTVVRDVHMTHQSAGVNPAHRGVVLALLCHPLRQQQSTDPRSILCEWAKEECTITHLHPAAIVTEQAVVVLCYSLIHGATLMHGLTATMQAVAPRDPERIVLGVLDRHVRVLQGEASPRDEAELHQDGFSPLVLDAALHFLTVHGTFGKALTASLEFAGQANYCPVLVGAIGGALYGVKAVPPVMVAHRQFTPDVFAGIDRVFRLSRELGVHD